MIVRLGVKSMGTEVHAAASRRQHQTASPQKLAVQAPLGGFVENHFSHGPADAGVDPVGKRQVLLADAGVVAIRGYQEIALGSRTVFKKCRNPASGTDFVALEDFAEIDHAVH